MMQLILYGCGGAMGRAMAQACDGADDMAVAFGVDVLGAQAPFAVYHSLGEAPAAPADAVLVDFSRPDALEDILAYALQNALPLVLCTTGYTPAQEAAVADAARQVPVFRASNMSVGVNVLTQLCVQAARMLGDSCDVEIVETHHNRKADSPSGTALSLAGAINEVYLNAKTYQCGRSGKQTRRSRNEIGIQAVRGGNIVGEHEVMFFAPREKLTLFHAAYDRAVFADGALQAARYLLGRAPGLYSMADLLAPRAALTLQEETVAILTLPLTRETLQTAQSHAPAAAPQVQGANLVLTLPCAQAGAIHAALGGTLQADVLQLTLRGFAPAQQAALAGRVSALLLGEGIPPLALHSSAQAVAVQLAGQYRRRALEVLVDALAL